MSVVVTPPSSPPPESARRVAVLGSGKTVHRYARHLAGCGAEARAVEVLQFTERPEATAQAVEIILDAQRVGTAANDGHDVGICVPRLQVILTSSVAVRVLHAALAARMAAEPDAVFDTRRTAVLTLKGCGTAAACTACAAFANIAFVGSRLAEICDHLETLTGKQAAVGIRTLLLGVATGGDRSYRDNPALSSWVEEFGVYESTEVADALGLVRAALRWVGPRGSLVVTSSKSAKILAHALGARDLGHGGLGHGDALTRRIGGLHLVAQGQTTAATLRELLTDRQVGEIVTPGSPNVEAIAVLLGLGLSAAVEPKELEEALLPVVAAATAKAAARDRLEGL